MAKKVNKKVKAPISSRFGGFVARTVPGSAVKLGRLSGKAGRGTMKAANQFKEGFLKSWDEV